MPYSVKSLLKRLFPTVLCFAALCGSSAAASPDAAQEPGNDAPKAPSWDVENPPGDTHEVSIDTQTGTWLSVDVHPKKDELVFDLLGNLYLLPLSGGNAKKITSGMAWDMQPKYSPDGRWIAFTSDRGGGDNLWLIPSGGGEATPISSEKYRLLNSPAWSPDSQFVAGRKHFTSRRSLGAGEIWLYHRAGGVGTQLTKKANEQKDLGEPAFSPDGRYLYYSQDITPGKRFQYNKDPNRGIYAIKRLELATGETDLWLKGAGGAIRPTPSPDGKHLAFIRRVRGKTALFVQVIQSGEEKLVYDDLDRDMQETWAVHGVYPSIAWSRDSKDLIFWSKGRIHRITVRTKQISEIHFRVKDTRRVSEPLHFSFDAAPREFEAKMLRWVQVAPNEKTVLFQALGHIYVRGIDKGKPTRLTRQNDHFEHYPTFSPDGRWIAYTTWDDQKLGTVRVISTVGRKAQIITSEPGHYVEPEFSPDSQQLLYRKVGGGYIRSPLWSSEPGIYLHDLNSGEGQRLHRTGRGAHFGADPRRIYFLDHAKEDHRVLKSVDLLGGNPRTHADSKSATHFRVSPDGKWLLFRESFQAYLTLMTHGKTPRKVAPDMKTFPIARLSSTSAWNLHWSRNSERVYWSLGAQLFEQSVARVFDFASSEATKTKNQKTKKPRSRKIVLKQRSDVPPGVLVLSGGAVVTMEGDAVILNGMVVIKSNRIVGVGAAGSIPVPKGAAVIDTTGMTILPGLIDVHAHAGQATQGFVPEQNWENYASLAFGVTTIHDPSNHTESVFAAKELALAGRITSPRIFSTGTILYGAKGDFRAKVNNLKQATEHVQRMKEVGATSVKSYNQPRRDQRQQVIAAARQVGVNVFPEGGSLFQHNMTMIVDGHTGIEHAIPVANAYDDVVQLWSGTRVGYTPTLSVAYGGLFGENYWYQESEVWKHPRLLSFVPRQRVDPVARRATLAPSGEWNHPQVAAFCKRLVDAGVRVQLGAHGQREGLAAHWELWMLVEGGLTPHQALRSGTLHGAEYIGIDGSVGSITPGKLADLMVVEGDPLKDIRVSERVRYTIINGRIYDSASMNEIGNHPQSRQPFFWQMKSP